MYYCIKSEADHKKNYWDYYEIRDSLISKKLLFEEGSGKKKVKQNWIITLFSLDT